jgi:hypothetical protein
MWQLRGSCSRLLANGHIEAGTYPIGFLADEVALMDEWQNAMLANTTIMQQAAISSVVSRKGASHFKDMLKKLTE